MKRFLTKHGIVVLSVATVVAVVLSLLSFFSSNTNVLSNIVQTVSSPFRSAATAVTGWVEGIHSYLTEFDALQEENAQLKGAIKKNEEAIEAHSVRIAELMKEHEHGILTTTTDKLLVDFVTSTSRRVSSEYLKQNYPSIYEEARKPSMNRKVKVTIQPL